MKMPDMGTIAVYNVTREGVITGDLWEDLWKYEQSRAAERERYREEQRLEDLEKAKAVPSTVTAEREFQRRNAKKARARRSLI